MIRILVVDDHPVVREGLVTMLGTEPGFDVVDEAGDAEAALESILQHRPDIVLLDLELPGENGIALIRQLRERGDDVRVLVFTAYDTGELIVDAVRAGIEGYVLKGVARAELFEAIRTIHDGGTLLQASVTSKLLARVGGTDVEETVHLTPRENEVLHLVVKGLTNAEIGDALHISERTVKFHVSSLLQKLECENRTEATTRALQLGLIET